MYTIRIRILDPAPLDGTTPLDLAVAEVQKSVQPTGIIDVTLPVGVSFGLFDVGEIVGQRYKNFLVFSITVVSQANTFAAGDVVELVSPDLPSGAGAKRQTIVGLDANNGIEPQLRETVPIDHKLAFDTSTGARPGPYLVQLTLAALDESEEYAVV